jgi:2-dehydropantoate 2-reductase
MNALVIGAGSVGQVLAYYLHRGGNKVTFFVREEAAEGIQQGLVLYHLNKRNARRQPIHHGGFDVKTLWTQLGDESWDQIYLCVPSDGLRKKMLAGLKNHAQDSTIIKIQPGLRDRRAIRTYFEDSVVVTGMISFLGYRAPLKGEDVPEPGMAYWFPPFLSTLFSGSENRVQEVLHVLSHGGLPVTQHRDVEQLVGYVLALQAPLIAGLDCTSWSLREFARSPWLKVANLAIKEATLVVSRYLGTKPPLVVKALNRTILRLGLELLPKQNPIPLEAYLESHYTKLRNQSLQHLDDYIELGIESGLPVQALKDLRQDLTKRAKKRSDHE